MTIQENSLRQLQRTRQDDIAKVKEFTNITDNGMIEKAIEACSNEKGVYDLSDVIDKLIENAGPYPNNKNAQSLLQNKAIGPEASSTNVAKIPAASTDHEIYDLTGNDRSEAEGAESNQDQLSGILGGQITAEEREISRILEQSLEESKGGTKRKRADIWFVDPRNPHERKRAGNWPVGMKNVGNTCWFSAVVQSLFHVRKFRRQVLNFAMPRNCDALDGPSKRNLAFMYELRRLFGLMVASKRKYIDPSRAIDTLRDAFAGANAAAAASGASCQQDVSEFQHKLLEWLEEAFACRMSDAATPASSSAAEGQTDETQIRNPMVDLFYGHYIVEGVSNGERFSKTEKFSQFPLQVGGYCDVHESLEAATAPAEIEGGGKRDSSSADSGYELWFTSLPPILTLELSRFQYNQHLNEPEKIHARLEFPEVLYMDRYLVANIDRTRERRELAKQLQTQLTDKKSQLNQFMHYGSGSRQYPLADILQYAQEFAEAGYDSSTLLSLDTDVEMDSPRPVDETKVKADSDLIGGAEASVKSDLTVPSAVGTAALSHSVSSLMSHSSTSHSGSAATLEVGTLTPAPAFVSPQELEVLQSCMSRWRREIETNVSNLLGSIKKLEETRSTLYSDNSYHQHCYRLHAVLVHDGQAASGHYWVYVYCSQRKVWLRFNDITVTEASWEELTKESVGGHHNTSAYCLMYIRDLERLADNIDEDYLPRDVAEYVNADNASFQKELEEWDEEVTAKVHRVDDVATASSSVVNVSSTRLVPEEEMVEYVKPSSEMSAESLTLSQRHAQLLVTHLHQQILAKSASFTSISIPEFIDDLCVSEINHWGQLADDARTSIPKDDPRLENLIVYAMYCGELSSDLLNLLLLDQLANTSLPDYTGFSDSARLMYEDRLKAFPMAERERVVSILNELYEDYEKFRQTVSLLVEGVSELANNNVVRALQLFICACDKNTSLGGLDLDAHQRRCLDISVILRMLDECLLHLSEQAAERMRLHSAVGEGVELMQQTVLPTLPYLSRISAHDHQLVVEKIGSTWCNLLGLPLSEEEASKLQDCLSALYEVSSEVHECYPPAMMAPTPFVADLRQRYMRGMDVAWNVLLNSPSSSLVTP